MVCPVFPFLSSANTESLPTSLSIVVCENEATSSPDYSMRAMPMLDTGINLLAATM
jgi:hypothetical protein